MPQSWKTRKSMPSSSHMIGGETFQLLDLYSICIQRYILFSVLEAMQLPNASEEIVYSTVIPK
jgi:hypothetical protein